MPKIKKVYHADVPWDLKDIPSHTKNPDGTFTYTFTKKQKELLFTCLSQFMNRIDDDDTDIIKDMKKIRAIREGF